MENQEFDIELLEKKLEEYEQADSNVRSEEVLEFVKKVLDITLLQLSKGNVSDRDIEEDIRFVRDEIGKPDFLKQLVLHVQQAADRWASASKEENGQDYLFSELCLLIKLGRNAVCTLGFLCCREGKFGVLYDFMTAGNQVLGGYYDWKTRLRSYFMNLITPSILPEKTADVNILGDFNLAGDCMDIDIIVNVVREMVKRSFFMKLGELADLLNENHLKNVMLKINNDNAILQVGIHMKDEDKIIRLSKAWPQGTRSYIVAELQKMNHPLAGKI